VTDLAWVLLGAATAFAVGNWIAVETDRRSLEVVCKPATLASLIGVALALDPQDDTMRWIFVGALVFSLAGDVFLMLEEEMFQAGVGAFAIAHLLYAAGFVVDGQEVYGVVAGMALVGMGWFAFGRRIIGAVKQESPADALPVTVYMGIISLMVITAVGSGNAVAIAGAWLFYLSDACIAWSRFITPFPRYRLTIMATYHVGQALLVLSLVS
jgi:uncharacterized membrane protein YhhN